MPAIQDEVLHDAETEVQSEQNLSVDMDSDTAEPVPTPPGNTLQPPADTVDAAASPSVAEVDTDSPSASATATGAAEPDSDGSGGPADLVSTPAVATDSVDTASGDSETDSGHEAADEGDRASDSPDPDDDRRHSGGETETASDARDDTTDTDDDRQRSGGEPELPDDVDYHDLDRDTRAGLRSLPKGLAEVVGRRLIMAGRLVDVDPREALAHALVARRLASRIAVVREAAGVAAYFAGEWQTAISELRTAQRLTGTKSHVAVIADAERALGRPERAIDAYRELADTDLDTEVRIELLIVAAGARADMGHAAAGLAMLQVPELNAAGAEPWRLRLRYAYADALARQGRVDDARDWFLKILQRDEDDSLGVGERLLELDGVEWPETADEDIARDEP